MKELTIEEKAKCYDEAIERAKDYYKEGKTLEYANDIVSDIFPELKESKDEKMIQYFKDLAPFDKADELYEKYGFSHKDAIAWLEKQGAHAEFLDKIQIGDKVTRNEDGVLVNLSQLKRVAKRDEKQGEQNPAWSEEDEAIYYGVIETEQYMLDVVNGIKKFAVGNILIKEECTRELIWLKSIKDRVLPQPKQEWSEGDKVMLDEIIDFFENGTVKLQHDLSLYASWLKSLRPQSHWKPSDEQMDNLSRAFNGGTFRTSLLMELYLDLKKLKE